MPLVYSQIVEVTRDQAKQSLLDLLDSIGFTATSWQEGSIPLAMVELGADIWSRLTSVAVFLKEMGFNETSSGDALTRFSRSHYANERESADAAQRKITLTCAAGEGPHNINLGSVVLAAPTGQTFRNIDGLGVAYPFSLSSALARVLIFEAEVPGGDSNVGPNSVTEFVTTLSGVTVTADESYRLGVDEESDARLRLRNSTKWANLSQFEVIADGAVNIALNASKGIAQVKVDATNPRGPGSVDIYVAGDIATSPPQDVSLAQTAFNRRVFGRTTALVKPAPTLGLNLAGIIYFDATFEEDAVKQAILDATKGSLIKFIKTIPLGGLDFSPGPNHLVPKNNIEDTITDTTINGQNPVKTVVLTTPVADIVVGAFEKVVKGDWSGLAFVKVVGTP